MKHIEFNNNGNGAGFKYGAVIGTAKDGKPLLRSVRKIFQQDLGKTYQGNINYMLKRVAQEGFQIIALEPSDEPGKDFHLEGQEPKATPKRKK